MVLLQKRKKIDSFVFPYAIDYVTCKKYFDSNSDITSFWRSSYTWGRQYVFNTFIIRIEDTSRYGAYYK